MQSKRNELAKGEQMGAMDGVEVWGFGARDGVGVDGAEETAAESWGAFRKIALDRFLGEIGGEQYALAEPFFARVFAAMDEGDACVSLDPAEAQSARSLGKLVGESGKPLVLRGDRLALGRVWSEQRAASACLATLAGPWGDGGLPDDVAQAGDQAVKAVLAKLSAMRLSAEQKRAIALALQNNLTLITGGPGTGKTTCVAALLATLCELRATPPEIALLAPTGKAASHLRDSLVNALGELVDFSDRAKNVLAALEGRTMHSFLRIDPPRYVPKKGPRNPVQEDVIVVDEASMVDLSLLTSLLLAMRRGRRLILLGDLDQLPPVGLGSPLDAFAGDPFVSESQDRRGRMWLGKVWDQGAAERKAEQEALGRAVGGSAPRGSRSPVGGAGEACATDGAGASGGSGFERRGKSAGRAASRLESESESESEAQAEAEAVAARSAGALRDRVAPLTKSWRFGSGSGIGKMARAVLHGLDARPFAARPGSGSGAASSWVEGLPQGAALIAPLENAEAGFAIAFEPLFARMAALQKDYWKAVEDPSFGVEGAADGSAAARDQEKIEGLFSKFFKTMALTVLRENAAALNAGYIAYLERKLGVSPFVSGMPYIAAANDRSIGVSNGEIGLLLPLARGRGNVVCFRGAASVRMGGFAGGGIRAFPRERLPALEPAFAITTHKSQGSEYDEAHLVAPFVLENGKPVIGMARPFTKALLYTAITRAKKSFVFHGDLSLFEAAACNDSPRQGMLNDMLFEDRRSLGAGPQAAQGGQSGQGG